MAPLQARLLRLSTLARSHTHKHTRSLSLTKIKGVVVVVACNFQKEPNIMALLEAILDEMDGKSTAAAAAEPKTKPKPKRTTFLDALQVAEALGTEKDDDAPPPKPKKPKAAQQQQQQQQTAQLPPPPPPPNAAEDTTILGEYALVETEEQCAQAIARIRAGFLSAGGCAGVVFVDCEGVNLGRAGQLCLVQVSTVAREAFLFDVAQPAACARAMDAGLRELLESRQVVKVFHDARSDSDALWHCARVRLTNVFDTQLAHAVITRQLHSAGGGRPCDRRGAPLFRSAPIPAALSRLIARYLPAGSAHESKEAMHALMDSDRELWARRPLSPDALRYASTDVLLLLPLYRKLHALLSSQNLRTVMNFGEVYCAQIRDSADGLRVAGGDEGDVPIYGISEFDAEVLRQVNNLKKKGAWHRRASTPAAAAPAQAETESAAPAPAPPATEEEEEDKRMS